jgi:hypothetical protein
VRCIDQCVLWTPQEANGEENGAADGGADGGADGLTELFGAFEAGGRRLVDEARGEERGQRRSAVGSCARCCLRLALGRWRGEWERAGGCGAAGPRFLP